MVIRGSSIRCTDLCRPVRQLVVVHFSHCASLHAFMFFFFQAEDGIRDIGVTGVQTCALPILRIATSSTMPASGFGALRAAPFGRPVVPLVRMTWRPSRPGGGSSGATSTPSEIGRASCRERGEDWVGGGRLEKEG